LVFWLAFWLVACSSTLTQPPPTAVNGSLDLSGWDFERDGPVTLDGEWAFYWERLLTPADFAGPTPPQSDGLFSLPRYWNNLTVQGQTLDGEGFATFRLMVKLPSAGTYGLKLPYFNTAYRLWVNEALTAVNGSVGANPAETVPQAKPQVSSFSAPQNTAQLTLQVANFSYVYGGPGVSLWLGTVEQAQARREQAIGFELFLFGCFLLVGISHLSLYFLRRQDQSPLYLAIVCLLLGLWRLTLGEAFISVLFPQLSWEFVNKLEYLALYLLPPAFAVFLYTLYRQEMSRGVIRLSQIIWGSLALVVLVTPARIYTQTLSTFQALTLAFTAYAVWVAIQAVRHKREEAALFLGGCLILALAVGHDLVYSLLISQNTPFLTPLGLLGLILTQALILARKSARSYALIEAQTERLIQLNSAYYRFVPQEFLHLLGQEDAVAVKLGDQVYREMTVLFADVRSFTSLSERMSPHENFEFVNALLSRVSPLIREHGGFIDKYLGDGIMALFPHQPEDALRAAIAMRGGLAEFNRQREAQDQSSIQIGIGLHTGSLMLGTVGEPQRMDGTVIADAVNTASRLESLTKRYGVTVIASEQVLPAVADRPIYHLRELGKVRPKGKQTAVVMYEVFDGDPARSVHLKQETRSNFEAGLHLYQQGRFAEAREKFAAVLAVNPHDRAAAYYQAQSAQRAAQPVPADWDGVESLTEK
jgi:class 3 adenylate cyclase